MQPDHSHSPIAAALLLLATVLSPLACSNGDTGASECTSDPQCGSGRFCDDDGICRDQSDTQTSDVRRDLPSQDPAEDAPVDTPDETDDPPLPDTDTQDEGEDSLGDDPTPADTPDTTDADDPLASLSTACAQFCVALCDFLDDCGKDDPICLARCGASARYQALSDSACTEGSHVIGLEQCPLWLDCGGEACNIDEMCLEIIPSFSYACAPICDLSQAEPACPGGDDCNQVADAQGHMMSSLGMCWSLF